jgi:glutamate formiminotransferase
VSSRPLLAVPNVSGGRDASLNDQTARAFAVGGARVLDVHADPDHNRSVFTLAGRPGQLAQAVLAGARKIIARVDIGRHEGAHPHVGVLDVAPIVFLDPADLGAACAEALVLADLLADELELPVLLYGLLADGRTRAELRRGGPHGLAQRLARGELAPDFGPARAHPTAGVTLVAARPPLVAFNVWLADRNVAQVSTNVEDPAQAPLSEVVAAVARHAEVQEAELVGLAPSAAFDGFPPDTPVRNRRTIEEALAPSD